MDLLISQDDRIATDRLANAVQEGAPLALQLKQLKAASISDAVARAIVDEQRTVMAAGHLAYDLIVAHGIDPAQARTWACGFTELVAVQVALRMKK